MTFILNPYNIYDSWYEDKVRFTLSQFHINLSDGNPDANGPIVSSDIEWNFDGSLLISRESFVTTLKGLSTIFTGLQAVDQYNIVDGNVGAVLYQQTGTQTGALAGAEPTGKQFNVFGSELMVFDADAKLHSLITITQIDQLLAQITQSEPVPPVQNLTLFENPQTSPDYRQKLRDNMALLFALFAGSQYSKMGKLALPDVEVNADQTLFTGTEAFLRLFTANQDAFPGKVFHIDHILADGRLGAIECVWQGTQLGPYTSSSGKVIEPTGKPVRVRTNIFLEFNVDTLITKATWIHNEGVIEQQLHEDQKKAMYPLYP